MKGHCPECLESSVLRTDTKGRQWTDVTMAGTCASVGMINETFIIMRFVTKRKTEKNYLIVPFVYLCIDITHCARSNIWVR